MITTTSNDEWIAPGPGAWRAETGHSVGAMTPMAQHLFGTAQPVAIRQVFADWGVPRHDEIQRHRQSRPLLRFGLVDRMNLWVFPLLLGSGRKEFANGTGPRHHIASHRIGHLPERHAQPRLRDVAPTAPDWRASPID